MKNAIVIALGGAVVSAVVFAAGYVSGMGSPMSAVEAPQVVKVKVEKT